MKKLFLIIFIILLNFQSLFSQINLNNTSYSSSFTNNIEIENNFRGIYLFSSIGLIEIVSLGMGYQITDDFSFALKWSATWIGSSAMLLPNSASGFGIKTSYHKPFLFFNTASIDYIIYFNSTLDWESKKQPWMLGYEPFIKGHYFDVNVGRETINKSAFNFFWAIGVCISVAKEAHILYAPSVKIGLNYNFIQKEK